MADEEQRDPAAPEQGPPSRARYLIGCWFAIVGYLAGGMMGVAIAKIVGAVTGCIPAEGFPACDFERYLQVGSFIGLVTLPGLTIWRMWRNDASRRPDNRG